MSIGSLWTVIPVKAFHLGKSRLNLPDAQRVQVNRAFLRHVLDTATAVVRPDHVVVVSCDEQALTMARRAGARAVRESHPGDLNEALTQGAQFASDRGADAVLSLFCDLPDVAPDDVRAMIDAFAPDTVVLAPDESGTGTNAILMAPNHLPYRHGPNSLWRHLNAAREARLSFQIVRREGLARDIDTPSQWLAMPSPNEMHRALDER